MAVAAVIEDDALFFTCLLALVRLVDSRLHGMRRLRRRDKTFRGRKEERRFKASCLMIGSGLNDARVYEEAQQRGIAASAGLWPKVVSLPENAPDVTVKSADDVVALLSETISQVRRGQLDTKIANSIGYLAGVILKAREQSDLETRISALEETLKKAIACRAM